MNKSKGFTLIELLVVIAIIPLLMVILIPALARARARARNQARTITCQALLKQWGVIWSMYCEDNDGYFSRGLVGGA